MISPDQYLEYINSQDICKIKAKVTWVKFLKKWFHNCGLSEVLVETEAWIYLRWDMNYKSCDWWWNSFYEWNFPKIWEEFYFSVSRKEKNYVISANKEGFWFRINYDFSKVPVCSDKNILKEEYEKWYGKEQFLNELKFFEEWENEKYWEYIWFEKDIFDNKFPDFSYKFKVNSHNQVIDEFITVKKSDFWDYDYINIFDLRKQWKIKIPEFMEFRDRNLMEKNKKISEEIYDFVKTWKIWENIKLEGKQILKEKYLDLSLVENFLSRYDLKISDLQKVFTWKTNDQKEKIIYEIVKRQENYQKKFEKIYNEFRIVPKNEEKIDLKVNDFSFVVLIFVLFIFMKKIFKFSKNK